MVPNPISYHHITSPTPEGVSGIQQHKGKGASHNSAPSEEAEAVNGSLWKAATERGVQEPNMAAVKDGPLPFTANTLVSLQRAEPEVIRISSGAHGGV